MTSQQSFRLSLLPWNYGCVSPVFSFCFSISLSFGVYCIDLWEGNKMVPGHTGEVSTKKARIAERQTGSGSESMETNILNLQKGKPRRIFLGWVTEGSGKTRSRGRPRRPLSFAHHGHVGTTRTDLPRMRGPDRSRSNNCPQLSQLWFSRGRKHLREKRRM